MFTFALGLLGAFFFTQTEIDVRTVVMTGTLLGVSAFAFHAWQKSPTGTLHWDGQHWFWGGFDAHRPCRLALLLDFQRLVVVSVVDEGQSVNWLWLEAGTGKPIWQALRRAIVSSGTATPDESEKADAIEQVRTL